MSSFLERLKKKDVIPSTPDDAKKDLIDAQNKPTPTADTGIAAEQLKVDIFQSASAIIIYAQIAGATVSDYSVTIEGDGDIITIKGERKRPNGELFQNPSADGKEHVLEECTWGKFYRQIILPAEVDAEKTQAKMREGILMLFLPLKTMGEKGVRINVTAV
jgi:HSP20 family molecular chaperone IbpA